jgi:hypothetical protein
MRKVTKAEWRDYVARRRGTPNFFLDYILFSGEHYDSKELMSNLHKGDIPEIKGPNLKKETRNNKKVIVLQ